jgi:hypothetical protein
VIKIDNFELTRTVRLSGEDGSSKASLSRGLAVFSSPVALSRTKKSNGSEMETLKIVESINQSIIFIAI